MVPGAVGHVPGVTDLGVLYFHDRLPNESECRVFLEAVPTLLLYPKLWRKLGLRFHWR